MTRVLAILAFATFLFSAEPESFPDSVALDTTTQVLDSTTQSETTATSGWLIPLSVIAATAGLFIFLFTARTKS